MALKIFKHEYLTESGDYASLAIENEMRIMSRLEHPNILKLLDCGYAGQIEDPATNEALYNQMYIAMEYFEGQDLFDF